MKQKFPFWARALPRWMRSLVLSAAATVLAACGGVGEEGTGIQPAASVGALQGLSDSSVTVDGVCYDRTEAIVSDGFGQLVSANALRLGMWIEVQGRLGETADRGVAQTIKIRPAARGVVTARDTSGSRLTVFDSTVLLGNGTVLDGPADAPPLAAGDVVEVHGPLSSAAGDVSASRIEKLRTDLPTPARFELRGRVSQFEPIGRTLTLGRRSISYATANLQLRLALANRQVLRVSAAEAPVPGKPWVVDRVSSDQELPASLGFLYTEGFVDSLQAGPTFTLEGLQIDARSASGKEALTGDGQRVAVVGALANGVLKAKSVALVQLGEPVVFTLSGLVTDYVSPAAFRLRGVNVDASAASFVAPATPQRLADGVRIRIQATVLGRRLIASRVELVP